MSRLAAASLSAVLSLGAAGCSASSSTSDAGGSGCTPGQSVACIGPGGCSGTELCAADAAFDACSCSGGSSGGSTGTGTSGGTGGGSTAASDGGVQSQLGLLCNEDWDCLSGFCMPVGGPVDAGRTGSVCTVSCASKADCPAGWSCGPAADAGAELCQCQWSASQPCGAPDGGAT